MLYPLTFQPIFKERVWGGRKIEELYHKPLPAGVPVGESWEVSDRPGDTSLIANGPLLGKNLRWLMEQHGKELLAAAGAEQGRFPLLIKILDAQEKLSLQVHPPPDNARELGSEPKTEMWYIADAVPGAKLYVGLKRGVSKEQFQQKIHDGTVEDCVQQLDVRAGDAMFLPSGRIHAIGAGLVIFEIQQNSDTTYRVFDWNRPGLDGKPRALHINESLASINFNDFEPPLIRPETQRDGPVQVSLLVRDPLFSVELYETRSVSTLSLPPCKLQILAITRGDLSISHDGTTLSLAAGGFCLVPASLSGVTAQTRSPASFLRIEAGSK